MSNKMPPPNNLQPRDIEDLVAPMLLRPLPLLAYEQLAQYAGVLYRWNARMNLTAVRDPGELVQLHLAECLRCAQLIPQGISSVLDFGSGAGLPGIPIQIARPELETTLAESQIKKAAFLREAIRELGVKGISVFAGRVEDLPTGSRFSLVTLRAVDRMAAALKAAEARIMPEGWCMVLTSSIEQDTVRDAMRDVRWNSPQLMPGTRQRVVLFGLKKILPD